MAGKWTAKDIPDQSGRVAVVTGANSGLGLVTARELARAGAAVVLTARDTAKGDQALASIRESVPGADVRVAELDLADSPPCAPSPTSDRCGPSRRPSTATGSIC